MRVDGITWHALTLDETQFAAWNTLARETLGLTPMMEMPGVTVFQMPNGTILELYLPQALPPFGYEVACFPVKIKGASAGWSRVVAIFDDA